MAGILACVMLGLTACGNSSEPDPTTNNKEAVQTVNEIKTTKYIINKDKVINALNSTDGIYNNFDITTSEYRSIEIQESEYVINKTCTILCKLNKKLSYMSDGYQMNIVLEYSGDNEYPNTISITNEFANDVDSNIAQNWSLEIIKKIFNSEISGRMSAVPYNGEPQNGGTLAGRNITLYRGLDDMSSTLGKYMLNYVISIENETSKATVNQFNPSSNPKYLLFNTGLIAYNERLEGVIKNIAKVYDDSAVGKLVLMTDLGKDTAIDKYEQAQLKMDIQSAENGTTSLDVTATANPEHKLKVSTKTLVFKNKLDAFYNAEDILLMLTGKEIALEDYFEDAEIKLTINESGYNESWGYPLEVTAAVMELTEGGYQIALVINTVANDGGAAS